MSFDISYKPGSKGYHIEIVWNTDKESTGVNEHMRLYKRSIYEDIEIAQGKMQAIRLLHNDSNDICISATPSFFHEDVATRTWVLCEILKSYITMKDIKVFFVTPGMNESLSVVRKVFGARMLGMLPANVATPNYMARLVKKKFENHDRCSVKIFDHRALVKGKFGLILGIGDSARREALPTFAFIERKGKGGPKVAIVGKGVTFDSGGLAVKSFRHMIDMKYDKIGAAYGIAILMHLIEDPRWNHVTFYGAFPFAENAISATALHPGDVIRSYTGTTVEVANPDAEGRLIMADAFGYLHTYKPDLMIDVASLTGHASMISCWHSAYFYTNTESFKNKIERIGEQNGERMIPMPTWKDRSHVLKSNVADLNNSPRNCSDAYVAALFLEQFVPPHTKWVHFDLAHDTSNTGIPNGNSIRTVIGIVEDYLSTKLHKK
jgi:leucyl aminopeptidase